MRNPASVLPNGFAISESGTIEQTTDFRFPNEPPDVEEESTESEIDWTTVARGMMLLKRWERQTDRHRNLNGVGVRALITAWMLDPELQGFTLTQLARRYGRHKQSFGRWVDSFKKSFPQVRFCHMKPCSAARRKLISVGASMPARRRCRGSASPSRRQRL